MTHWIEADWPAPENIKAYTTLRSGGVSQEPFNSLNLATHVGDNEHHVIENRLRLQQQLKLPQQPLWLQQTHSNISVCANNSHEGIEADAIYSLQANTVCAVLTADCLPIVLCDTQGTVVAAIHGGWRGLLSGIIENTVKQLPKTTLMAWLAPAIGPQCFQVGAEVKAAFLAKSDIFEMAFTPQADNKYLADIYQIARLILQQQGVDAIYGGDYCTVSDTRFFSYRREKQTGRMATLIWRNS